jgi:predicted Zn-dependent protease
VTTSKFGAEADILNGDGRTKLQRSFKSAIVVMPEAQGETAAGKQAQGLPSYFAHEPLILVLLSAAAVLSFLAVTGLSRIYDSQQAFLGNRWFARGITDLQARHFEPAVAEFRNALLYSRDNYSYQLNLAEALLGLNRTNEAYSYLLSLWEREPENATVNLELARICAKRGERDNAIRYYHNAIYAIWNDDPDRQRRAARLELVEFLLKDNARPQAQAELLALAANLPDDPALLARVGDLFAQAEDHEHALAEYRQSLKLKPNDPAVMASAGRAAFELGRYAVAKSYLESAVSADPNDAQATDRLKTAVLVLKMDPFRRQISAAERGRIVIEAFQTAGKRLASCATASGFTAASRDINPPDLLARWNEMKPKMRESGIRQNPDLVEQAMDLVFTIERQTRAECGPPTGTDLALLLISKLHEGS